MLNIFPYESPEKCLHCDETNPRNLYIVEGELLCSWHKEQRELAQDPDLNLIHNDAVRLGLSSKEALEVGRACLGRKEAA